MVQQNILVLNCYSRDFGPVGLSWLLENHTLFGVSQNHNQYNLPVSLFNLANFSNGSLSILDAVLLRTLSFLQHFTFFIGDGNSHAAWILCALSGHVFYYIFSMHYLFSCKGLLRQTLARRTEIKGRRFIIQNYLRKDTPFRLELMSNLLRQL